MLQDWCTWDDEYNHIVQDLRAKLIRLATWQGGYTAVLMQGSGTFGVESVIGSVIPGDGKLLVLVNGAYGDRMARIADRLRIRVTINDGGEVLPPDLALLERTLASDPAITHVAVVHCETATGMLNPVKDIGQIVKAFGKAYIVDALSSFGGISMDVAGMGADFLISSANKCIQGVPGVAFVIYPGKVTSANTFRIGSIGDITPADIGDLLIAVKDCMDWDADCSLVPAVGS